MTPLLRLLIWLLAPRDAAKVDRMWCWLFHEDDCYENEECTA